MTDKNTIKNNDKNASYMQVINLSEKMSSGCVTAIIITAIVACIDIILMFINMEYMIYLFDTQLWLLFFAKIFVYFILILIEVFLHKIISMINKLSTTIFKYDENN